MPERYLLANAPEAIAAHALRRGAPGDVARSRGARSVPPPGGRRALRRRGGSPGAPRAHRRGPHREPSRGPRRAGLLATRVARGAARPSTSSGCAIGDGGTEGVDDALPRLARDLEDVCSGRDRPPSELLRIADRVASPWRERPSPAVLTEVLVRRPRVAAAHGRRGLREGPPGASSSRSRARSHELRLSIALSKINTEGTRVADVFYVSELDGSKVAPGARHQQIHDALVRAVESSLPSV